jgi:hypothetical protein
MTGIRAGRSGLKRTPSVASSQTISDKPSVVKTMYGGLFAMENNPQFRLRQQAEAEESDRADREYEQETNMVSPLKKR